MIGGNPFLADALLLGQGGKRTIRKVVPSIVYNTVDNPIFPTSGKRLSASVDLAGLGGNINFIKPRLEAVGLLAAHAPDVVRHAWRRSSTSRRMAAP